MGGYYKIEINSEGKGIICTAYLSEGTQLRFRVLRGATYTYGYEQGKNDHHKFSLWDESPYAALLYADDTPLVGAGGGSGNGVIDNSKFSAADYSYQGTWVRYGTSAERDAETIPGSISASEIPGAKPTLNKQLPFRSESGEDIGVYYATSHGAKISGANYLDTGRATLISMDADSRSTDGTSTRSQLRSISFRVEAIPNSQDDSYDAQISMANSLKQLVSTNKQITEAIKDSSAGGNDMYPSVTVCENQNFDVVVAAYDDMQGGTSLNGECTVINSVVGDGVVQLQGKFTTKGTYSVLINGNKFIVKVIEAPKPNSVTVILN